MAKAAKTPTPKPTKEEVLRHRVLTRIHNSFGGCFLDNIGQFLRACRLDEEDFVTQTAKARRTTVDAHGSQFTEYQQWFKITEKGKIELARLEALGIKSP